MPNLKVKSGAVKYDDYTREGWSRRGVRSRLDRRRSLKESLKRAPMQQGAPPFTNDDLRYRQLALRRRPATEAVVYFAMDVSSSMTEHDRKLAKTFFFWVVQGLRRQYTHLDAVFVAHTVEAWEFAESEFFQVSGSGGTVASTAFCKILEIAGAALRPGPLQQLRVLRLGRRELPQRSRGGQAALTELGGLANYVGYVETASIAQQPLQSETATVVRAARRPRPAARIDTRCRLLSPCGTRSARSSAAAPRSRTSMNRALQGYAGRLEALAHEHGLDYYPVQFEEVPSSFMMEVAVYGLPVRMPHWSFGVRYIYQLVQHRMGHSRLFEVVFPGNPGRAYLAGNNSLQENTLVTAHVLGHADFAKNNSLFKRSQEQVGYNIVEQAAAHARQIGEAVEQYGQTRVEQVLDAALSLEAHIDPFLRLRRKRYPAVRRGPARRRRKPLPEALRQPARRARPPTRRSSARARRFRRRPSATCCGSSPSTRRSSRTGSATCSVPCARNRSISIPCSRARS